MSGDKGGVGIRTETVLMKFMGDKPHTGKVPVEIVRTRDGEAPVVLFRGAEFPPDQFSDLPYDGLAAVYRGLEIKGA